MKSIIPSVFVWLCLLGVSCGFEPKSLEQWLEENENRLEEVSFKELKDLPVDYQRDVFGRLPNYAKANIWIQKVDVLLKENWTDDQQRLLEQLYEFITPDLYRKEGKKKIEPIALEWYASAKQHFSSNHLLIMMSSLGLSLDTDISTHFPQHSCTCSIGSDFSCAGCLSAIDPCRPVSWCGFLWMYTCDGTCPG